MRLAAFLSIGAVLLVAGCSQPTDLPNQESERAEPAESSPEVITTIVSAEEAETMFHAQPGEAVQVLPGRWSPLRTRGDAARAAMTPEQRERAEQLEAIGYVAGTAPASDLRDVTLYQAEKAYPGYNLYNSGHGPEALLTDMEGNVLHTWRFPFERLGDHPRMNDDATWRDSFNNKFWRRVHLFPNGDLLVIFEGLGIIKIDKDSNLIWAQPNGAHHDLQVMPNGDIYVLTREARLHEDLHPDEPILEDFVTILSPDGAEKRRVSLLVCLKNSPYGERYLGDSTVSGDLFHTNSLEVLEGRVADVDPAFAAGNILASLRNLDAICVIDLEKESIVWLKYGGFAQQHDPRMLDDGNMLIFDNTGAGEASRVLEVDFAANQLAWSYEGSADDPFYTRTCGTAQRLPNGNTLITESDTGRAFEVTPDGTKVWEFYNPHRAGERDQYIATLFEVIRLPQDFPVDWADGTSSD